MLVFWSCLKMMMNLRWNSVCGIDNLLPDWQFIQFLLYWKLHFHVNKAMWSFTIQIWQWSFWKVKMGHLLVTSLVVSWFSRGDLGFNSCLLTWHEQDEAGLYFVLVYLFVNHIYWFYFIRWCQLIKKLFDVRIQFELFYCHNNTLARCCIFLHVFIYLVLYLYGRYEDFPKVRC